MAEDDDSQPMISKTFVSSDFTHWCHLCTKFFDYIFTLIFCKKMPTTVFELCFCCLFNIKFFFFLCGYSISVSIQSAILQKITIHT